VQLPELVGAITWQASVALGSGLLLVLVLLVIDTWFRRRR
jgi:hypothetical protein